LRVCCCRLWGLSAERWPKTDGWRSKWWRKCSCRDERVGWHRGDGLLPRTTQSFAQKWIKWIIFKGLGNSKGKVFNVKKLLNAGVDLTLGEMAKRSDMGGMRGRFGIFCLSPEGFHRQMSWCWHLPSSSWMAFGPVGPEDLSWWKIRLAADSALACNAKTTQRLLAEFWFLADWPPY
jgi:hypothetical protein